MKVYIVVRGGNVQEVYGTEDAEVEIIDYDTDDPAELESLDTVYVNLVEKTNDGNIKTLL